MSARLVAARSLARQLSHETDRLNLLLGEAEESFRKLALGVSAQVQLLGDDDATWLVWTKEGADWGLFAVSAAGRQPLTKASRAFRIAASACLPKMLDALIDAVERQSVEVHTALTLAEDFLRAADRLP